MLKAQFAKSRNELLRPVFDYCRGDQRVDRGDLFRAGKFSEIRNAAGSVMFFRALIDTGAAMDAALVFDLPGLERDGLDRALAQAAKAGQTRELVS